MHHSEFWRAPQFYFVQKMYMHIFLQLFILITVGTVLPVGNSLAAEIPVNSNITSSNWYRHPQIVEIRNIYNEIQTSHKNKQLKFQRKDYTVLPESCRGTYPIEYLSLGTDSNDDVRVFIKEQRISHGDLMTTQYYYDSDGNLRFVYITIKSPGYATIEIRDYLDINEQVIWDVRAEGKKITFGDNTIEKINNHDALATFNSSVVKCEQ